MRRRDRADGLPSAKDRLQQRASRSPTSARCISAAMLQDSGPFKVIEHVVACATGRTPVPAPRRCSRFMRVRRNRCRVPMASSFNRDVRDAVEHHRRLFRLPEIAERALHIKQLVDRRYIFPAGEEDLEQEWLNSNIARLKQILDDIPDGAGRTSRTVRKGDAGARYTQRGIHLAIKGRLRGSEGRGVCARWLWLQVASKN